MLENGCDIRLIQQFLGHTKLDTTSLYTQVAITHLQEVYNDAVFSDEGTAKPSRLVEDLAGDSRRRLLDRSRERCDRERVDGGIRLQLSRRLHGNFQRFWH